MEPTFIQNDGQGGAKSGDHTHPGGVPDHAARKASTNRLVVQAMCPVGSVILDGNSQLSVDQTAAITAQLLAAAPSGVGLFISTDQEGGQLQRMRGPGFQPIASAVVQGAVAPATLRSDAKVWGAQLATAGINLDLAPVFDTVPAGFGSNPPIGDFDREYGNTPAAVTSHAVAVAQGLADAGVDATAKHFPGLGRVRGNTDTTAGVTDSVTTRNDAYLAPFAAAVAAGVPFVMMSTAIYSHHRCVAAGRVLFDDHHRRVATAVGFWRCRDQ